jgi:hypothetical protein
MFYQYGLVYMGARMLNNISASMIQFYLIYVLNVGDERTGGKNEGQSSTPI